MNNFDNASTAQTQVNMNSNSNSNKFDPWKDEIDKALPFDMSKFRKYDRNYSVRSYGTIPDNINEKIRNYVSKLSELGFTYRHGPNTDPLDNFVYNFASDRADVMLPWANYGNKEYKDIAKVAKPLDDAYRHAAFMLGKKKSDDPNENGKLRINTLGTAFRANTARNVHLIVGDNLVTPINLFICYSPDGASTRDEIKYETTGYISFFINTCEALNIPVFNLQKPGTDERLDDFLKTFI